MPVTRRSYCDTDDSVSKCINRASLDLPRELRVHGNAKRTIAPPVTPFSARIRPWCRSTIEWTIMSPTPKPCAFVVKNDSKR